MVTVRAVIVRQYDDEINNIEISFQGPDDSPYMGGTFIIRFELPPGFPWDAPKVCNYDWRKIVHCSGIAL